MKHRFLFYLVFMVVGVVFIDVVLGYAFRSLEKISFEKYPQRFEVRARYAIEKDNSEIDIIGASDASHNYISQMIEDSLNLSTFNNGKDGCFFIYQNCLINMMLENHTPKVILWEIGKNSLSDTPDQNPDREWQFISDFYPYYDNNNYCKTIINGKSRLQKWFMLSNLYRYNSRLLNLIKPFIVTENVPDTKGYIALPNTGYIYPTFDVKNTNLDNVDNYKETILIKTLNLCQGKGVRVFFCFSPKYKLDKATGSSQFKRLKKIAEEYSVGLVDYENNSLFMKDSTLFKDNAHLNDKGARLYMEHFIPDFKNLLAEQ